MFCQNCGTQNTENTSFCKNCGKPLNNINSTQLTNEMQSNNHHFNKKTILIIIGIIIIVLTVILIIWFINKKKDNNYGSLNSKNEISYSYSEENIPKFIDGTFSSDIINSSEDVLKALESIKDKMQFKDIPNELKLFSEETNEGITYYKFDQIYNNIPVYKQNIIVMVDKDGKITGLSGYYIPNIDIDITPKKSKEDIEKIVKNILGESSTIVSNELYVWAEYDNQKLIYVITGYSDENAAEFMVDANTGEIITETSVFDYSNVYSYTGMGLDNKVYTINLEETFDLLRGKEYSFYDSERNISISDYRYIGILFGILSSSFPGTSPIIVEIKEGKIDTTWTDSDFIQNAITTMANYETIYDYYKNVLGRNSYDNKGSKIIINLGVTASTFTSEDLNNASWCTLTNQMYIGNLYGKSLSASLDVLGHEFTHGVIEATAQFATSAKEEDKNKAFETGALNEGYADVMGSLIEGQNWTMAENNTVVRDAENPEAFENPSVKGGDYYYPDSYLKDKTLEQYLNEKNIDYVTDYDKGGVHTNSNVVAHAAYLMYEAGAFSSREEMAKVWYNSLLMLSSYSNFEDAALSIIKAAKNLGLSEASIYKITKALQDTKMLESNDFSLKGSINSGKLKLKDVNIEIYSYNDDSLITSTTSDGKGLYDVKVPTGTYRIKVTKKNFKEYTTIITIKGETSLNIELASNEKFDNITNVCETSNCVNFTVYFMEGDDQNRLKENHETYAIEKGTILSDDIIVDRMNKLFKSNWMSSDGKSFYMTIGGIEFEFGWYYKDTDIRFDYNEPITEDTEIEAKFLDGLYDYDYFINLDSYFKS